MPGLPFLNDNANRHYPFIDNGPLEMVHSVHGLVELPAATIVEFVAIAGLDAGFLEDTHRIYLYEILRSADQFYFTFRSDAPGLVGLELTFCRRLEEEEFATDAVQMQLSDAVASLSASLAPDCEQDYLLEGWLTTGALAALAEILEDGETLRRTDGEVQVEPAQVQSLYQGFLRTVNLANKARTVSQPAEGCGSLEALSGYVVETACLAGELRWKPGFNCVIRQSTVNNSITILAAIGAGEGHPCEEVPLYEGEESPDGGQLLTGGPACNEIIKSINGISGDTVRFLDGLGVRVSASEDDPHTIVVDINLHGLAICAPVPVESSSGSLSAGG